jgi:peptidoglycan hydrolase-like protein with peptidoglycan-binding domain
VAVVVAGGAVSVGWFAVAAQPRAADEPTVPVSTATAEVTRGTVSERVQVSGSLGFDGSYAVVHRGEEGVVTAVAAVDATVNRGEPLYAVAERPVRLLYGETPAYRGFAAGMSDGSDVRQLEENLVALGMDPGNQITVDARFTTATAAAIRRWQATWGLPPGHRTGGLAPGQVVFQPGAMRISEIQAAAGTAVRSDQPVLSATSTTRVVTAQVTAERRRLVHIGDQVTVTLPGVAPFPGTVVRVGRAASTPAASNESGPSSAPATVPVTISVAPPDVAGDLDQAPVQVAITRQARQNVLMVPVSALLARPGGGYRVRLESGQYVHVEPGLFDSVTGAVEVAGELTAGQRVQVPAP